MGLFSAIRSVFGTGDDEPLKAQEADVKRESSFSSNSNQGCDEIPGAHGSFGTVSTNPIPVNGIIGEMVYLNRLRAKSGVGFMFHRTGSLESPVTTFMIDHYELVATDASEWQDLYFCPYFPRRSRKAPKGLYLMPWSSLDDSIKLLSKFPCMGTNARVANFPLELPKAIQSCERLNDFIPGFAESMSKKVQATLDRQKRKWRRHRMS